MKLIKKLFRLNSEQSKEFVVSLKLTVPMIITSMLGMLLSIIDTYVAGTISIEALTAVSVGNSIFWLVAMPLVAIVSSIDVFYSRAFGASDRKSLDSWLVQSFWLSGGLILIGLPLIFLILLFYRFTSISDEAFAGVLEYLDGLLPSLVLLLIYASLEKYWNCQNRVRLWTVMSIILLPVNYFLNLYISTTAFHGLNMGVFGIGVTTTICYTINLLVIIAYSKIMWNKSGGFHSKKFRPDLSFIKRVLKLGLPSSGQTATDVLGFSLLNYMAAFFGNQAVAVHQVVFVISTLFYMMASGWSNAASIRIGYYLGSNRFNLAAHTGACHLAIMTIVFSILSIIAWSQSELILGVFLSDPHLIEFSKSLFLICVFMMTADAIQCLMGHTLRAWGDTTTALYTNLFAFYVVGVPLAYYLAFYTQLGILGIWIGLFVTMITCAGFNLAAWFYVIRKYPMSCIGIAVSRSEI